MRRMRWIGRWLKAVGWAGLLGAGVARAWAAEPMEAYRFGTAEIHSRLTNQFLLRNAGSELMEVRSATASCDCVTVQRWDPYVEAGATGAVEILFAPDQAGEVDYRVLVATSSPDQPEIEYAIQGLVVAAARPGTGREWALYLETEEAGKLIQDPGGATWVDVRREEAHGRLRIPGSLQIPLFAVKAHGFLRDRRVVLVDDGHGSPALEEECRRLREMGFADLSIWYGGLNAWRRRGGQLEGGDGAGVDRVPPVAMNDIACAADWLVVDAGGGETHRVDGAVAIPFDASKADAFTSALDAAVQARPQVASVLIATETGEDYGAMAEAVGKVDAFAFHLEGGWTAWEAHRQMMGAIQHGRTVVSQSSGSGGVRVRPGGCGGCPK